MDAQLIASNVMAHWVQSGLIAAASLSALKVLKVAQPRLRLSILHVALLIIVALPWVQPWRAPYDGPSRPAATAATVSVADSSAVHSGDWLALATTGSLDTVAWLLLVIVAGAALRLAWLAAGLAALWRFSRCAKSLEPPAIAEDVQAQLAVTARYVEHNGSAVPITFGWRNPTIALPSDFSTLEPAFQRSILSHELVHVKRRDAVAAFIEEVVAAVLWFHPWIWILRSRIRTAREHVVDRQVIALTNDRSTYIRCLVRMSGHDLVHHLGAGLLRPSELRSRIDAIYEQIEISRIRQAAAAVSVAGIVIAVLLLAARAVPLQTAATDPVTDGRWLQAVDSLIARSLSQPARLDSSGAYRVRGHVGQPVKIKHVAPVYPEAARTARLQGSVTLEVRIDETGRVTDARPIRSVPVFDQAAIDAVKRWRYIPVSIDGVPVPSITTVIVRFGVQVRQADHG